MQNSIRRPASARLRLALWAAQAVIAFAFLMAGWLKVTQSMTELSEMMSWVLDYPQWFVRVVGVIDLAGGIGILLPALLRIKPGLTVLAALGCAVLQVLALAFHVDRGDWFMLPVNLTLIVLALFVFWGRMWKAPIRRRG